MLTRNPLWMVALLALAIAPLASADGGEQADGTSDAPQSSDPHGSEAEGARDANEAPDASGTTDPAEETHATDSPPANDTSASNDSSSANDTAATSNDTAASNETSATPDPILGNTTPSVHGLPDAGGNVTPSAEAPGVHVQSAQARFAQIDGGALTHLLDRIARFFAMAFGA